MSIFLEVQINGATADINLYIDAAGAESILELYQKMGKIESRIVMVAVLAGKRPVDILSMMYAHQALSVRADIFRRMCAMFWIS